MKDISEEITSYQSAKDVAKALRIKPVTLKKYSLIIEKISKGNVTFERSEDKSRLYTATDVTLIRSALDTRNQNNLSYEKAVESILKEVGLLDATDDTRTVALDATLKNDLNITANALFAVMNEQNAQIDQLIKANKELVESNKELSSQMKKFFEKDQESRETKEIVSKKKKWWFFKNL